MYRFHKLHPVCSRVTFQACIKDISSQKALLQLELKCNT